MSYVSNSSYAPTVSSSGSEYSTVSTLYDSDKVSSRRSVPTSWWRAICSRIVALCSFNFSFLFSFNTISETQTTLKQAVRSNQWTYEEICEEPSFKTELVKDVASSTLLFQKRDEEITEMEAAVMRKEVRFAEVQNVQLEYAKNLDEKNARLDRIDKLIKSGEHNPVVNEKTLGEAHVLYDITLNEVILCSEELDSHVELLAEKREEIEVLKQTIELEKNHLAKHKESLKDLQKRLSQENQLPSQEERRALLEERIEKVGLYCM